MSKLVPVVLIGGSLLALLAMSSSTPSFASVVLSARRKRAIDYIDSVVPSSYNDSRFMDIVGPGYNPNDPNLPKGYSTCGALPGRVGHVLGYKDGITQYGVMGVRTQGIKKHAWVLPTGKNHPSPADFLLFEEYKGGPVKHVAVAYSVSRVSDDALLLVTADSGQGTLAAQASAKVNRLYYPKTGLIVSFTVGKDGKRKYGPKRYLAGWLNLDALPPPDSKSYESFLFQPRQELDMVPFDNHGAQQ